MTKHTDMYSTKVGKGGREVPECIKTSSKTSSKHELMVPQSVQSWSSGELPWELWRCSSLCLRLFSAVVMS